MATWAKEKVPGIHLFECGEGPDKSAHQVDVMESAGIYPDDKIECFASQKDPSIYFVSEDLDTTKTYIYYIDQVSGYGSFSY
jgi:hypothetical protein